MKKISFLLISLMLVFALVSCDTDTTTNQEERGSKKSKDDKKDPPKEYSITYNNLQDGRKPTKTTFWTNENVTLESITRDNYKFVGWFDASTDGNKVTGWNAGDKKSDVTVWVRWTNNYIENQSGDFVINGVRIECSCFAQVMDSETTIVGSDDNWSSYLDSSVDDCTMKGVFIKDRTVTLSPYKIGKYPVTQKLFAAVMGINPSECKESNGNNVWEEKGETDAFLRPVDSVSRYDAIAFCNKLSLLMGKTPCYSVEDIVDWLRLDYNDIPRSGNHLPTDKWRNAYCDMNADGYRLPTEAEWEFAARGGKESYDTRNDENSNSTWYYAFSGIQSNKRIFRNDTSISDDDYSENNYLLYDLNLALVGWYGDEYGMYQTFQVGILSVNSDNLNPLGLYDMSGNVSEWCEDWFDESISTGNVDNPKGPDDGDDRVRRGGSHSDYASMCCVSCRDYQTAVFYDFSGFRLVTRGSITE